ncbi:hypothetical protein BC938DRAFT_479536 [Jimgerdemannia flammicorona]|uniref:Centromere/kinetochore protein zw10 middle domain-containing protein n=1 Tax=Jimgerdemannia flammicorona TaxID=994334 RepID=A0A433QKN2_9FUNG|nr:hypothetical protein BC938DRAFT_479536 [Jimgerdemannia flammicorona]
MSVTFAKKYYDTPVTVDDLLASFAIMDVLPQKLEAFTRRLLCDIVTPLVRDPVQELTTTRNKLHATLKVGRAGLAGANGGTNGKVASLVPADITTTLNKLLDLGRFLSTYLFRPDSTPVTGVTCMSVLGQIWWLQLWRELKVAVLEPSIPDDRAMLAKYEATVEGAIDFETEMMALGRPWYSYIALYEFHLLSPTHSLIPRFQRKKEILQL